MNIIADKMCPIPKQLIKDNRLTAAEKMLYIAICTGDGGEFVLKEFADIIGRNVKTARKYLHHLIINGWITYENNVYSLNIRAERTTSDW